MKKNVLLVLFIFGYLHCFAKIEVKKVEPENWWIDMKNPNLQLMVYGENISSTVPEIDYPGVEIKQVQRVENQNYLFLDLYIDSNTKSGDFDIVFKDGKKTKAKYKYQLLERNKKAKIHQGFDASDVVYLALPDRFANGDISNDSTNDTKEEADRNNPDGRHGGDLQGVINHLDYISDMGFTALWLNPFLENNQSAYSYHGYAISDIYKVDPREGTNELFVELVDKAHDKDVKVIMDMIFNHWGIGHWMMEDLPEQSWINQHDTFVRSNFRSPVISDPYASQHDRDKMLAGWFDTNMPDLNQRNPLMATYLIQNTIWWIEYSGIDGIRVDTQPYAFKEFMSDWTQAVLNEYPSFNIVGETWLQKIPITAYFQGGKQNKDGYDSHMPCVMDFPMCFALNNAFKEDEGWTTGLAQLYYVLAQDFEYADPSKLFIFPDNHDLNRYFESQEHDFNRVKMGLAFLFTTRGIPQIYYGTEILMDGKEEEGHGYIRKDFPGGWPGDEVNAFTGEGLSEQQKEAQLFVKNILNWRKNSHVIHSGKLMQFLPEDETYVMFRYNDDNAVMLILNNNDEQSKDLDTSRFNEILKDYTSGKEIISGDQITDLSTIHISPKSALIIELNR